MQCDFNVHAIIIMVHTCIDVEEVEELLGDIAKNEKYPDDAQIEKDDIGE